MLLYFYYFFHRFKYIYLFIIIFLFNVFERVDFLKGGINEQNE